VLTVSGTRKENALTASEQVHSVAAASAVEDVGADAAENSGLKETVAAHE
jgi:hypothetical protein